MRTARAGILTMRTDELRISAHNPTLEEGQVLRAVPVDRGIGFGSVAVRHFAAALERFQTVGGGLASVKGCLVLQL